MREPPNENAENLQKNSENLQKMQKICKKNKKSTKTCRNSTKNAESLQKHANKYANSVEICKNAKNIYNWHPKVSLDEGLKRFFKWTDANYSDI